MVLEIEIIDIFYALVLISIVGYIYANIVQTKSWLKNVDKRVQKVEDQFVSPDVILDLVNRLVADVTAINMNQSANSSPKSINKFKINQILTDKLLKDKRMNLDELQTMAFYFDLNGKSGIDFTTQMSAARGILQVMNDRRKVIEVAQYIQETRPDIFEDTGVNL